ncbi:MAG: Hsp20/alpha crystallin family protein, partial [Firmicutes bacterium]|nr:Hsp20/alpha crystallin family protein [Bacillota bacterium]
FDRFFTDFPLAFAGEHNLGGIRVDVYETEDEVVASCDLPGLRKKEDVHIEIVNNTLNISGTINKTEEIKDERLYRKERYVGRFQRSISLPSAVSDEGAKASYKNGVLEVRMPKKMDAHKKRIDIDFH